MSNLSKTIDALGDIRAQIAELTIKEKALKEALGDLKPGNYEGDIFRVSITQVDRETLDMKAVREKLSPQFIAAHTNVTPVRTIKVAARSGRALAA